MKIKKKINIKLPAGNFSSWLRQIRKSILTESGTKVACGDCTACCSSSYYIRIGPKETQARKRIRKDLLVSAPGLPKGYRLLVYEKNGLCPMLKGVKCSIYNYRPKTCRIYDCRIFTAAGISAGGKDNALIAGQAMRWKFNYPGKRDRDEHLAVKTAAKFIRQHPKNFPGGRVPENPSQLAILAIKVYDVFLDKKKMTNTEIADEIVKTSRKFDRKMSSGKFPAKNSISS